MHNMQNQFLHINMINFILSMVFRGAMLDRFYIIHVRAFETLPSTMIFNYTHSGSSKAAIWMQAAGNRWVSSDCEMADNCTAGVQKSNSCGTMRDKGSSADFDRWPDREQSVSICRLAHLASLERSTWILDQCSSEQVLIEVFASKKMTSKCWQTMACRFQHWTNRILTCWTLFDCASFEISQTRRLTSQQCLLFDLVTGTNETLGGGEGCAWVMSRNCLSAFWRFWGNDVK